MTKRRIHGNGLELGRMQGFGKIEGRPEKKLGEQQSVNEVSLILARMGD